MNTQYVPQYMVASIVPEESPLGRGMKDVRAQLRDAGIPFLFPKPKDHITFIPPSQMPEDFARGLAKGLRFCKAFTSTPSQTIIRVTGCDYFGENDRALAVELDCGEILRDVVEDLRASIQREWWVHIPDNHLFRPHATIAHQEDLKKNIVLKVGRVAFPHTSMPLPLIRLLVKAEDGVWYPMHF
jgi:2'-5' RNA ligase